ncbi:MAG: methyltransferase domain-containing protein [Candidatus Hydrogenedens sp.]|nr:methyltransferase domain-containing protein [Candidatus Hydrogenedens sp.]
MSPAEDSYGTAKRFAFVAETVSAVIATGRPARVLDVGCGTGSLLSRPLAEAFPALEVTGIDADAATIAWAAAHQALPNLHFATALAEDGERPFDLVIASEVLEHVEDPPAFLLWLRRQTRRGGRVIVTVPNGYGPFEAATLAEVVLHQSGLIALARRLAGRPERMAAAERGRDTLAVSPHINFFGRRALNRLFTETGLSVRRFARRTFLCGFLLDQLVGRFGLAGWNARIADRLPAWAVSDWMVELVCDREPVASAWRRGRLSDWRRRLNERRWGLG